MQLTVDLLLATLPHVLLGAFHSAHVLPCVGGDALGSGAPVKKRSKKNAAAVVAAPSALTTSLQLFSVPSLRLLVLQQRAPAIRGRHRALVSELLGWARGLGLAQTVLLTSSLAFRKNDEELDAVHPVSFFSVDANGNQTAAAVPVATSASAPAPVAAAAVAPVSALESLLRGTLQWNSLHPHALQQDEQPCRFDQLNSAEEDEAAADNEDALLAQQPLKPIAVPGLGITRPFFEAVSAPAVAAAPASGSASSASSSSSSSSPSLLLFPTLFLHVFVNEGANNHDAAAFAQHLYTMLYIQQQQHKGLQPTADTQALVEPQDMTWTPPASWASVFGNEAEDSLYL